MCSPRPEFRIEPIRGRNLFEYRRTEVVVSQLHREAMTALVARRTADFLAAELRGQLLARDVELVLEDRIAPGRAEKWISVRPCRFLGERIPGLERLELADQPPIHLEIYLAADEETEPLAVYAAGTLVAEGFDELDALGLDHPPWTDPRLTGLVDYPGFTAAPGSRRGVVPDTAAGAFVCALHAAGPRLSEALAQRQAEELDRKLVRDLQRASRGFFRQRPRYALLPLQEPGDLGEGPAAGEGTAAGPAPAPDGASAAETAQPGLSVEGGGPASDEVPELSGPALPFPPGPLAAVEILPSPVRLYPGAARRVRTRALDARGAAAAGPVSFHWSLDGEAAFFAALVDGEREAHLQAWEEPGEATLRLVARAFDGASAEARSPVLVRETASASPAEEGIPEPELVEAPGASWRSRLLGERWRVNSAHPEYRAIRDRPQPKVRDLAMPFAKEVVLRSSNDPRLEAPLEQLVEIAAYADRNLDRKGRRRPDGE